MKIHHLDCGTMCPVARRWVNGTGGVFERGTMVCHCFLIEGPNGLILVDTGMGTQDAIHGFGRAFDFVGGPTYDPAGTAIAQVEALGFDPKDVRDLVVTHLDLDHAGGIADFPHARVHLHSHELAAALEPASRGERERYLARQWAHGPDWQTYDATDGEPWFGFEAVRDLKGLPPEILLIPLFGHTRGHTGIAVKGDDGWLLHGGDAWFHQQDLIDARKTPVGLRLFQRVFAVDNPSRLANLSRLQTLAAEHSDTVRLVSAHDPSEFAACRGH
jgi:glyoxylase-like metal-dependent hydrolase (beta-lactamase superfamily II)